MEKRVIEVYKFEELSPEVQEKVVEKFRDINVDYDWWDNVYEDAANVAETFGLDIRQTRISSKDGKEHWYRPTIYFSGFSSQGDGACYEGMYSYKKGSAKQVQKDFPTEVEIHELVKRLHFAQQRNFFQVSCKMTHSGHYYHSGCMQVHLSHNKGDWALKHEDEFIQIFREFADWIYSRLEKEYNFLTSDGAIRESIISNEYEFDVNGNQL